MTYLLNSWYVLAWSSEVGDAPFARTVLDVPVVVYRSASDGALIALRDRCPHRFAPLSLGAVVGDRIQCGYHGLEFDREGRCVHNPLSQITPAAARVDAYPVVERGRAIWIWPGDRSKADTSSIPDIAHQTDPDLQCVFGLTTANADYRLLSDNLMDLSHSAFLHPAFGGINYLPKVRARDNEDGTVTADFVTESMPNFIGPAIDAERVRNHDSVRWIAPSNHILDSRIGPVGEEPTVHLPSAHLLTPQSKHTTHYFWSSAGPKDSGMSDEEMIGFLTAVFDGEDKPMVEAVQRSMGERELDELGPVLLPNDVGAARMRRRLAALIAAEAAGLSSAAAPA